MTHQEFDKRLDEGLEKLVEMCGGNIWYSYKQGIKNQALDEAKQAIRELFVEVVGEDKGWDVSKSDYGFKDQGKNELRQELRTTITGEEGGDE